MIVREDREGLCNCIREYLDENITAFQFDEKLGAYRNSQDETVCAVALEMWYYYDDCKNHKVVALKREWDYWQRLLLVLESGSELAMRRKRVWHLSQLVALCGVVTIVSAFWIDYGIGILCWFFLWPVSIALSKSRERRVRELWKDIRRECYPFSDLSEIRLALGHARHFGKPKYPASLARRRIRDRGTDFLMWVQSYLVWCFGTPLVLCAQTFPLRSVWWIVRIPNNSMQRTR